MNLTLQPQASFTVVRQIANHLDTDVNYVQAVIRNAYTDAIIETIQLTSRGSQRFSKNWQVPADSSGQGFYVSIVTSVYTDAAYTTKNANYGDEENTYLVQDRLLPQRGGGVGVDAYTVRRIIKEELEKLPEAEKFDYTRIPQPKDLADRTDEILEAIKGIKEPEKVDLAPVLAAIEKATAAIDAKEVTEPTDLTPVIDRLQQDSEANGTDLNEIKDGMTAMEERLVQTVETTIKDALDTTEFTSTFSTRAQPKPKQPTEAPALDVSRLAQ